MTYEEKKTLWFFLRKLADKAGYKVAKCKDCNGRHNSPIKHRRSPSCDSCENTGIDLEKKLDRPWTCGKRPSVKDSGPGCGVEYELPPKKRTRRRHTRVNECRTTTCPKCGHVDALYKKRK